MNSTEFFLKKKFTRRKENDKHKTWSAIFKNNVNIHPKDGAYLLEYIFKNTLKYRDSVQFSCSVISNSATP